MGQTLSQIELSLGGHTESIDLDVNYDIIMSKPILLNPIRIKANLLPEGCKKYAVPKLPCVEQKAEVKRKLPRSWMDMKY